MKMKNVFISSKKDSFLELTPPKFKQTLSFWVALAQLFLNKNPLLSSVGEFFLGISISKESNLEFARILFQSSEKM